MQPHDHGHRAVYHLACPSCLALDLARSPDVHVRRFLQGYRREHGREALKAMVERVQAARQEAKP